MMVSLKRDKIIKYYCPEESHVGEYVNIVTLMYKGCLENLGDWWMLEKKKLLDIQFYHRKIDDKFLEIKMNKYDEFWSYIL